MSDGVEPTAKSSRQTRARRTPAAASSSAASAAPRTTSKSSASTSTSTNALSSYPLAAAAATASLHQNNNLLLPQSSSSLTLPSTDHQPLPSRRPASTKKKQVSADARSSTSPYPCTPSSSSRRSSSESINPRLYSSSVEDTVEAALRVSDEILSNVVPGKRRPEDRELRRQARIVRNRMAAQLSREKKKRHADELEAANAALQERLSKMEADNAALTSHVMALTTAIGNLTQQLKGTASSSFQPASVASVAHEPIPSSVVETLRTPYQPSGNEVAVANNSSLSTAPSFQSLVPTTPLPPPNVDDLLNWLATTNALSPTPSILSDFQLFDGSSIASPTPSAFDIASKSHIPQPFVSEAHLLESVQIQSSLCEPAALAPPSSSPNSIYPAHNSTLPKMPATVRLQSQPHTSPNPLTHPKRQADDHLPPMRPSLLPTHPSSHPRPSHESRSCLAASLSRTASPASEESSFLAPVAFQPVDFRIRHRASPPGVARPSSSGGLLGSRLPAQCGDCPLHSRSGLAVSAARSATSREQEPRGLCNFGVSGADIGLAQPEGGRSPPLSPSSVCASSGHHSSHLSSWLSPSPSSPPPPPPNEAAAVMAASSSYSAGCLAPLPRRSKGKISAEESLLKRKKGVSQQRRLVGFRTNGRRSLLRQGTAVREVVLRRRRRQRQTVLSSVLGGKRVGCARRTSPQARHHEQNKRQ
ncbi:hypothetical protein DFJ73DRAFT_296352 [Zopfochytrium polystomum]|nr:hypothetical protein DFJ73DRAFT_296352 [Zopfochytrium polystomum]